MEKLCTNKNHSYKHNEQINKQNIDNSECFGQNMLKFIQKWLHNNFLKKYGFGWLHRDFFYISEYFRQMTVFVYITLFSKLINVAKVRVRVFKSIQSKYISLH
jgi:hypothetical protein